MKKTICLLALLSLAVYLPAQKKADRKLLGNLQSHITYLASDKLEGRRTGTPGEKLAAEYIAAQMKQAGLAPKGDDGYLQTFTVREGKVIGESTKLSIDQKPQLAGEQFIPLPFSAEKAAKGEVLADVNEPDNIWLINVKDFEPNPHARPTDEYLKKTLEAAKNGASGVIFFNGREQPSQVLRWLDQSPAPAPIPAVWVNEEVSRKLDDENANGFQINLQVAFSQNKRTGTNVIGYINNGAPKTVVLGAHFDHLGYGEDRNSLATAVKAIHNGADDNASGTAAMLELGRLLKSSRLKNNNFILVAFSGEELGLFGSKYFTEHSPVPPEQVNFMINMDMVGRLDASKGLQVGGIGTSPSWAALLEQTAPKTVKLSYDSSGVGPSDHTSFYRKHIPVLFFFTGTHADYHKPSDDVEKINFEGELSVIKFVYAIIEKANSMDKLAFSETLEPRMSTTTFSVTLGIMPDYTYNKGGVRIDGISDGRPAQKAGMAAGDIIVQMGATQVSDLEAYMQALSTFKKGDKTTVKVKRGKEEQLFTVVF